MKLWTNVNLQVVWDDGEYIDVYGNRFTASSDKSKIPELSLVTQNTPPSDQSLVVTGYQIQIIDGIPQQVWNTRSKTDLELSTENKFIAQDLLDKSDITMIRIAEAVAQGKTTWGFSDVVLWFPYRDSLRPVAKTGVGVIPATPPYPQGT